MFSKFRSLIFKFDPELAHDLAIKSLKFNILPKAFVKDKSDIMFQTKLFGTNIDNPIGLAAGFDKNAEVYNSLYKLGFGFVEVGTITPIKQIGNPKPRIFRLVEDQALINRLGFNNLGAEKVNFLIRSNPPKGLLGINIGPNKDTKDKINDYLICLRTFHDIADYITINISSPNTEHLRDFHDQNKFQNLIIAIEKEMIKLKSNTPIVIKISPDILNEEAKKISEVLLNHSIQAVIISNSTDKNRGQLNNHQKYQKGGLSGKPLETRSNELIKIFYNLLKGKIPIIGVGGVDSGQSAYDKFLAGASFIQLYTGMVYQGPNIIKKIKNELKIILTKKRITNFEQIIGKNNN